MAISQTRLRTVARVAQVGALVLFSLGLVLTFAILIWEARWVSPKLIDEPKLAYAHGTIGTELMPLPVAMVLPDLFPEHFQPAGMDNGDWIQQFGFIRRDDASMDGLSEYFSDPDPDLAGFPVGFVVSNYRPRSGAPSPVKFVGFACILCHSTRIQEQGGQAHFVVGPGNSSLNLFAWQDAFLAAMLDEDKLTLDRIEDAYHNKTQRHLSAAERLMIRVWLRGARQRINAGLPRFDEPFGNGLSRLPESVPMGPGRTMPFTTFVRQLLGRPGARMAVYTKVAPNYREDLREWAQVDGSVSDLHIRSALAALAAGATIHNLELDEIRNNVMKASDFTRNLTGPKWDDIFPNQAIDAARAERGRAVYTQHCSPCHGQPDPQTGAWQKGSRYGEIVPLQEIGTDPERLTFRHFDRIPDVLTEHFPKHHPFRFDRKVLRPGPAGKTLGYVNGEISSAFTRAPYLHNASVPTLAQLIHLEPRPVRFYRGANYYDPAQVGLAVSTQPTDAAYFLFDTTQRGNSNRGHDYPWAYDSPDRDEGQLRDLVEYLKTL